ncbi:MAG: hypothetical protein BWY46_01957 [Firmicutes bacterium ADurb.Bin300]|nr:MAG: hypothetical protein BWY46_01957 [Firmicutes bacterium ADurb.Bin300]
MLGFFENAFIKYLGFITRDALAYAAGCCIATDKFAPTEAIFALVISLLANLSLCLIATPFSDLIKF